MDAFKHVNNVVYFRYFEKETRIVYSEKAGLHAFKERTGVGPILGSTNCRNKLPFTYPDTVSRSKDHSSSRGSLHNAVSIIFNNTVAIYVIMC